MKVPENYRNTSILFKRFLTPKNVLGNSLGVRSREKWTVLENNGLNNKITNTDENLIVLNVDYTLSTPTLWLILNNVLSIYKLHFNLKN